MQETQVLSLGQEDPLEEGMATHSSILAWSKENNKTLLKVIKEEQNKCKDVISPRCENSVLLRCQLALN